MEIIKYDILTHTHIQLEAQNFCVLDLVERVIFISFDGLLYSTCAHPAPLSLF